MRIGGFGGFDAGLKFEGKLRIVYCGAKSYGGNRVGFESLDLID
jgi:hypothetical protein